MSVMDNDYGWITQKRKGTIDDPFVSISEQITVINGKAVLREIPDEYSSMSISNGTKTFFIKKFKKKTSIPDVDNVVVDFNSNWAYFDAQYNNKQFTANYQGTGKVFIHDKMIATTVAEDGTVLETLDKVVSNTTTKVDAKLAIADTKITAMNTATTAATNATAAANSATTNANNAATAANTAKTNADSAAASVNSAKDGANTAAQVANNAASAANTAKTNADNATSAANTAATAANTAKTNADIATIAANTAKSNADSAAANANSKATYAQTQGDYAKASGDALVHKGTYNASTAYIPKNIVYYNGSTFMCMANTTGNVPTNTIYWQKITNMLWKGIYSSSVTYNFGDVVSDSINQNVYMCILDNTLNKPLTTTTNWSLLVSVSSAIASANTATSDANSATSAANSAAINADNKASLAVTATTNANIATTAANNAKDATNTATALASTATTNANTATANANTARDAATTAATNANTQATFAQTQGSYAKDVGDSLVHRGDYSATLSYLIRNIVYYNGCTFMCILNTTAGILPTNATYWKKITAFNWKGTYNTSTTYQYGDFVIDSASQKMYLCIKDATLNVALTVGANWTPILDISSIVTAANMATTNANTATNAANTAKTNADTATGLANTATTNANNAATAANKAKANADTATTNANTQADYAKTQGDYAQAQADAASVATGLADTATTNANNAASVANTAKTNADIASTNATNAASSANSAANAANTAKTNADTATGLANIATTNANNATTNANALVSRTTAKGTYNSSTTYYPNNIVTYNGSSYICTVQALNKIPTDTGYWQMIALKGNDGAGSVVGITSTGSDIVVAGTVQNPDLAVNSSLKSLWNDKYTKAEVDSKINQATANIQWKPSVASYANIAIAYPSPQDGWTVNVNDTDYTYRYTGSQWIAISANSIPNASASADGKMSITDYNKLQGITVQATKVVNSATNGNITINGVENVVYSHPTGAGNNHIPSGGASGNYLKYNANGVASWSTPDLAGLSDTTITTPSNGQYLGHDGTKWVNSTLPVATSSVSGLMNASDKAKLDSITSGANNYSHPNGDGNLHVPANGTTSNGKFLEATASAGVYQWANITASDVTQDSSNRFVTDAEKLSFRQGRSGRTVTFTVNGDADKYYPVLISGAGSYAFSEYSITRGYGDIAPSTWNTATHKGGLTLTFRWSGDIGWGGNDKSIRIIQFNETYSTMVAGMNLTTSGLIVWLRGGTASYKLQTESGMSATATVYLSGYTASDNTVYPVRTNTSSVADEINSRFPIRGTGSLFVGTNLVWHYGNMGQGSGMNADMVDGFHLNQDVRDSATPEFNGIKSYNRYAFISKMNGYKTWTLHHPDGDAFVVAPSTTSNGSDWDWGSSFTFQPDGRFDTNTLKIKAEDGQAPIEVTSKDLVANLNADMVDGYHLNQDLRTTASPKFAGIDTGTSFIGGASGNATLRITGSANGAYLQGSNSARTASAPLWLTGLNGAAGEIRTFNNVLDDGTGNTTISKQITSPIFKSGNYSIQYNALEDSLDFVYG
ncbi:hypothetical protein [Paenibacillus sp. FSL H3-0333]|uniref:hypothetical protein n=1 Tax=Paenibacillus sp. FSL H3-0333 TaxID=2921373 RepID=UPI0030F8E15C